jgi:hypothetical protein
MYYCKECEKGGFTKIAFKIHVVEFHGMLLASQLGLLTEDEEAIRLNLIAEITRVMGAGW